MEDLGLLASCLMNSGDTLDRLPFGPGSFLTPAGSLFLSTFSTYLATARTPTTTPSTRREMKAMVCSSMYDNAAEARMLKKKRVMGGGPLPNQKDQGENECEWRVELIEYTGIMRLQLQEKWQVCRTPRKNDKMIKGMA